MNIVQISQAQRKQTFLELLRQRESQWFLGETDVRNISDTISLLPEGCLSLQDRVIIQRLIRFVMGDENE
ncbi:hypothetical protein LCGC14_2749700 [marine sediment metagenome]|uniref:Uncharacterized protein n=1 Tax=marine sediment metagenome TaxID=412755 RepID=A0A0F8ZP67_9ZZZZ